MCKELRGSEILTYVQDGYPLTFSFLDVFRTTIKQFIMHITVPKRHPPQSTAKTPPTFGIPSSAELSSLTF